MRCNRSMPPEAERLCLDEWETQPGGSVDHLFSLRQAEPSSGRRRNFHLLHLDLQLIERSLEIRDVLEKLEGGFQLLVGTTARNAVFIHAGVVAWRGRAILFPGRSLAGKSTLVKSLLAMGATYYSDEFAVLDASGRVHPYRRPISLRSPRRRLVPQPEDAPPIPIGAIVSTQFSPGSEGNLERLTSAQAGLVLFENALAASLEPSKVLDHIAACLQPEVICLQGNRGEAGPFCQRLLRLTDESA